MGIMAGEGETCGKCGNRYDVVWLATDDLWRQVTGKVDGSGLLCPNCFHEMAWERGITLCWGCAEGTYPSAAISELHVRLKAAEDVREMLRWLRTNNALGGPALRVRSFGGRVEPIDEELARRIDALLA